MGSNIKENEHLNQEKWIFDTLQARKFKEAELAAIELVKVNPFNPQGWVFLGEALMLQEFKTTAIQVFDRARLLDPEATWTDAVYSVLLKLKDDLLRIDIEMLLELPPVAVSAIIIVKDEERCIQRCLESLEGAVDEIIVLDTGSTDQTVALIGQFPHVKLYHHVWQDDFSLARNVAIQYVTSDWVIVVDADEYLLTEDKTAIQHAAALFQLSGDPAILRIGRLNSMNGSVQLEYDEFRMFPRNNQIRYWGRVHEQIGSVDGLYAGTFMRRTVRVRFHHDGYEPQIMLQKGKIERRLRQLELMIKEDPDHPGWWFFYGRELMLGGAKSQALDILLKAEQMAESFPAFGRKADIQRLLAQIYMSYGLLDEAEAACRRTLKDYPDFPDAHYTLGLIELKRAEMLLQDGISEFMLAKSHYIGYRGSVAADEAIAYWKADEGIAEATFMMGDSKTAQSILDQAEQRRTRRSES